MHEGRTGQNVSHAGLQGESYREGRDYSGVPTPEYDPVEW